MDKENIVYGIEVGANEFNLRFGVQELLKLLEPYRALAHDDLLNVYTLMDNPNFIRPEMNPFYLNFFGLKGLLEHYRLSETIIARAAKIFIKPHRTFHNPDWVIYERMRVAGFETVFSQSSDRDVDPLIIKEISDLLARDEDICLNLVSGDKVYLDFAEDLKESCLSRGRRFILRVFSWNDLLAEAWKRIADDVIYWEDTILFVSPYLAKTFENIELDSCFKKISLQSEE